MYSKYEDVHNLMESLTVLIKKKKKITFIVYSRAEHQLLLYKCMKKY